MLNDTKEVEGGTPHSAPLGSHSDRYEGCGATCPWEALHQPLQALGRTDPSRRHLPSLSQSPVHLHPLVCSQGHASGLTSLHPDSKLSHIPGFWQMRSGSSRPPCKSPLPVCAPFHREPLPCLRSLLGSVHESGPWAAPIHTCFAPFKSRSLEGVKCMVKGKGV